MPDDRGLRLLRAERRSEDAPEAALEDCDRVLKADPGDAVALTQKAYLLDRLGRGGEAIALIERRSGWRDEPELAVALAHLYLEQRRTDAAIDALARVEAWRLRQFVMARADAGEVLALVNAACARLPDDADLLLLRARLHEADGEIEHQVRDLNRVLELKEYNSAARDALRRLGLSPGEELSDDPVFRAFDEGTFFQTSAWRRLRRILAATGGPYGLVGARGSGSHG